MISPVDAAELLSRLVACPSVNPARGKAAGPPFGEGPLTELLASVLGPWGAQVRRIEIAPGRFNFIARFEGADPRRSLLLETHADTVSADGMTVAPFAPAIRDGRLYGRGSCDAKGPMAAMLLGIREAVAAGGRPPATLHFVATGDEEFGATGAHRLMADGFRADAAVVGEPTGLAIVHAHKGAYRFRIVTHGCAAHSSDPRRGINAIARMATIVQALEGPLAVRLAAAPAHPVLTPPTVSVGLIRGGTQINIVPDRCEIEVDRRTLPGESREAVERQCREAVASMASTPAAPDYDFEPTEWYPGMEEDPRGPAASVVAAACEKVLGRAEFRGAPWASNAGIFREAGIPSVVFGPGFIAQAHTAEEYIDLDQVVRAAAVYAEIIRTFR